MSDPENPRGLGARCRGLVYRGLARLSVKAAWLPMVVLMGGSVAPVLPKPPPPPRQVAPTPPIDLIDPDVLKIDAVLAKKAPELGLSLRRRIAVAIIEESRAAGYDPLFVLAIIDVESDFDERAVSSANARGLMQIRPATLGFVAEKESLKLPLADIYRDPALQVRMGVRYLARLEKRFRNINLALMAYNAGPERLRQSLKEGDIERFKGYARAVHRDHARFRRRMELENEAALAQASTAAPADVLAEPPVVDEGTALP